MRTTLNLDDHALAAAMQVAPGKSRTEIINEALREYALRKRRKDLLDLRGTIPWEGDLDALRKRV